MLTDSLTWRELELVHNFACHDRRIRRSARRRLRNSVIVSQLGPDWPRTAAYRRGHWRNCSCRATRTTASAPPCCRS